MSVKMTNKQLIELRREESLLIGDVTYTTVEEGDWDGAGEKYQTLELIFTDGERFYSGCITRSGSYFSDWNYEDWGDAEIDEVRKVTRTITEEIWETVEPEDDEYEYDSDKYDCGCCKCCGCDCWMYEEDEEEAV